MPDISDQPWYIKKERSDSDKDSRFRQEMYALIYDDEDLDAAIEFLIYVGKQKLASNLVVKQMTKPY